MILEQIIQEQGFVILDGALATELEVRGADLKHCLLYTSPSPRDGLLSRMPSSA